MQRAIVHTDMGEQLRLLRPDRLLGGKALLVLLQNLEVCCSDIPVEDIGRTDRQILEWCSELEMSLNMNMPVHHLVDVLITAYYQDDYTLYEYSLLSSKESSPEKREVWLSMYKELLESFADVDALINEARKLLNALTKAKPRSTSWYEPSDTLPDLQALLDTLLLVKSRGAKRVLIQFA